MDEHIEDEAQEFNSNKKAVSSNSSFVYSLIISDLLEICLDKSHH